MVNEKKHVQEIIDPISLEDYASSVLEALNDEVFLDTDEDKGYRMRMPIVLIGRLQQIESTAAKVNFILGNEKLIHRSDESRAADSKFLELYCKLNRFLNRFKAFPNLELSHGKSAKDFGYSRFWQVTWESADNSDRYWREFFLLTEILEIAKLGAIRAFRKCEQCHRWMFARRPSIDRFCSQDCREMFHRTNEADKLRRSKWMRDNYQTRKELELGSRKAAAKKRGKR